MARSRELKVVIAGDADRLQRELRKSSGALDKFGKQTRLTGTVTSRGFAAMRVGAVGATAAMGGIAVVGKQVVAAASDVNESLTKNRALFGRNSKAIEQFAKTTATSLGISRREALAAAGTFGGLFSSLGVGQKPAADMSKRLITLAADLASFNNASPEETLEAIRSGLVGETEPLRRFGVNLNDATLRAEALRMGLVKTTKESLEPQTRALAVNSLLFKQTAKAQGDFARTSDGLANQQRKLRAKLDDAKVALGDRLLPTVTKGIKRLTRFVGQMQAGTGSGGRFVEKLKAIWSEAKPIVTWIGRAGANVARFTAKHPEVGKLAAAVIGVGLAVKTLKFASAATGFTDLLKLGRATMKRLVVMFTAQGAAAGAGAGAASAGAEGLSGKAGAIRKAGRTVAQKLLAPFAAAGAASGAAAGAAAAGGQGLTSAAAFNKIRSSGGRLGKVAGRGLVVGLVAGVAAAWPTLQNEWEKLVRNLPGPKWLWSPKAFGKALGIGDVHDAFKQMPAARGGGAPGGGGDTGGLSAVARSGLSQIMSKFGGVRVSSGHRTVEENKRVGGAANSDHLTGNALDLVPAGGWSARGTALLDRIAGWARRNPAIRWIGWRGVPGHGPGDHLHLSFRPRGPQGLPAGDVVDKLVAGGKIRGKGDVVGRGAALAARAGRSVGLSGADLVTMVAIAGAESGYNPKINAAGPEDSRGLWQINVGPGANPDMLKLGDLYNPLVNAKAMKIIRARQGLGAWTVYRTGAYKNFIDQARRAVLASRGGSSGGGGGGASGGGSSLGGGGERAGSRIVNTVAGRLFGGKGGINALTRFAAGRERVIAKKDTEYGQAQRRFGQSEEDLGTPEGRAQRLSEIGKLRKLKQAQLSRQEARKRALDGAVKKYDRLIKALRGKLKGKRRVKGAAAVRIRKRIGDYEDRRIELAAEARSLGSAIEDTKLDLDDLAGEAAEVAATPDTAAEAGEAPEPPGVFGTEYRTASDFLSSRMAIIDAMERAGDLTAQQAKSERLRHIDMALSGTYGALSDLEALNLRGDRRQITEEQTAALDGLAAEIKALRAEVKRQTDFAQAVQRTDAYQLMKGFADMLSGQIVGYGVAGRSFTPGVGVEVAY